MLKSFKKAFLLAVSTSVIVMALVFVVAKAGSLTPSGPVGSTMKSLQELYDALAGTFNSASQSANVNGNIIQQLKYISGNLSLSWTQSGNDIYNSNSGNVGIGQAVPSAALHIKAGTAAAGTAPLKLAAGINLAAPEAGAIEFDGTSLFYTDSVPTRRTIANLDGTQTFTNKGRVAKLP